MIEMRWVVSDEIGGMGWWMRWDGGNRLWMRWDGWIDDAC